MEQVKELLGAELYHQVKGKIGDKRILLDDENFIPKSRFNKVIQKKNAYKDQVKLLNEKLEGAQRMTQVYEELVKKLQETNEKIKEVSLVNAIHLQALKANAKNIDAVNRLIDRNNIVILEDGTIIGLEEQLKALQESKPFLFSEDTLSYLTTIHDYVEGLIHARMIRNL